MKNKFKVLYTSDLSTKEIYEFNTDNIEVDVKPFIKVNHTLDESELKEFTENYKPEAIVLTSQQAVHALYTLNKLDYNDLAVLALSEKIADQIKGDFNSVIVSEESNVDSVAQKAVESLKEKRILHLNGNLRRDILKNILLQNRMQIENYQVYTTEFIQQEVDISQYDAVAFSSYSGIDSFFSKYELTDSIIAFTIGTNTSVYLRKYFQGQVFTSSETSIPTLLKEIKEYFSND